MNIEECIETTDIIINEGLDIINDNIQLILQTWKTAYEKEKEERERIGKLYYEANENCIKYEKMIEKEKGENVKLRLQDIPLIEGELKAYKDRVNELKQELEKEKEKNKELTDEYLVQRDLINPDFLKEYIHKDKIKEKIEEVNAEELNLAFIISGVEYKEAITSALQSLLEKE